jgi:PhzF family phenazine biosynthesis protein
MNLKIYQVDAFTDTVFSGNPAAVCVLETWLKEETMQHIAEENNLSETVFLVKNGDIYDIRWFAPTVEIDLCGHATLAAAFVLFHFYNEKGNLIQFYSHRSGSLSVEKLEKGWLKLNFPTDKISEIPEIPALNGALGVVPIATLKGKTDYMVVVENADIVRNLSPNFFELSKIKARGVIVTARSEAEDFVSRFFAPQSGINEDPVTGSAHTSLVPYWSQQLQKKQLLARQVSSRGGVLQCEDLGERVSIAGQAVCYLIGEIII